MSDRHLSYEARNFPRTEAARLLFLPEMRRCFWWGVLAGISFIAALDLGDVHVCVGECDGAGYDIAGPRK